MNMWANELNTVFSNEEVQVAKDTWKKMLNIPSHKEMQIKTMLRFHFTTVRMTTIKDTNNHFREGYGKEGN
jgi:uncharacterized membrane protein YpjA